MVLELIRRGRLVPLSKAQRRPRVSKLRAKGLSGLPPEWATTEAARRGARGPNKELLKENRA
jgi:hypothetical protein